MRTLLLTAALVLPATALAQSPAVTAKDLAAATRLGERVIVTARVPCREAEGDSRDSLPDDASATCIVKGRLTLLPDRIVVRGNTDHTFFLDAIDRIERPKDRIWNGAGIGYVVGFVPFAAMEINCRNTPGCWEGFPLAVGAVISGPIGFGIGALSDALIRRPRVVYSRMGVRREASIAPLMTRGGAGMRVTLVF